MMKKCQMFSNIFLPYQMQYDIIFFDFVRLGYIFPGDDYERLRMTGGVTVAQNSINRLFYNCMYCIDGGCADAGEQGFRSGFFKRRG